MGVAFFGSSLAATSRVGNSSSVFTSFFLGTKEVDVVLKAEEVVLIPEEAVCAVGSARGVGVAVGSDWVY